MAFAVLLIFAIFAVPIGGYIYYVALYVPAQGRARQEQTWRPLAERLGGRFVAAPGGARFHSIAIPYGATEVLALVFDRAPHDAALEPVGVEIGGWRTFVQAFVPGQTGIPLLIAPRGHTKGGVPTGDPGLDAQHVVGPQRGTHPQWVASRITPGLAQGLIALGSRYDHVQAGPALVVLQLPGVCTDPAVLEAAIRVVGELAQPPHQQVASAR
jgi:hypothetical protein